ncbi:MAG: hypothetical protein O7H41_20485 [Planctomycetota bacterium]|nr:hypothetical protein [Planctomycetota bacterium]
MPALLMGATAGCKMMRLRYLDQDMPTDLVERYKRTSPSSRGFVDETAVWIPFLVTGLGFVARTKDGFIAQVRVSPGPLGLIRSRSEWAYYDSEGRLLEYSSSTGVLRGHLMNSSYYEVKTDGGRLSGGAFKIAHGLLGYQHGTHGSLTGYLFFFPIPLRSAAEGSYATPEPESPPAEPQPPPAPETEAESPDDD